MVVKLQVLQFLCMGVLLGTTHAVYQEMTHVMDMETMMYPPPFAVDHLRFNYRIEQAGTPAPGGPFVAFNAYSVVEHLGTHFDAPYHFYEDGRQTQDIPLEDLHGPLVRIDITDKVAANNMSTVEVSDILAWEDEHGQIPARAYILKYSGWSQHWGDQLAFVGTGTTDPDLSQMAWPGFSLEAVAWLLENRGDFLGLGSETLSCDLPNVNPVHMLLLPADKFCLENLNNIDKVPASGAEFYFFPLFIEGGTGGQIRAFAFWDTETYTGAATRSCVTMTMFAILLFGKLMVLK